MVDRQATPRIPAPARTVHSGPVHGDVPWARQLVHRAVGDEVWQSLLDSSDRAIFVQDSDGVVRVVSSAAADVCPALVPGVHLREVEGFAAEQDDPVELTYAGVGWRWTPCAAGPGHTAWHGAEIDEAEPWCDNCGRSRFLANTSRLLASSLHRGHTLRSIVQLAVPTLADCCVVVLPARRGRVEWTRFTRRGDAEHGRVGLHALRAVTGLAEVFSGESDRGRRAELVPEARADWLLPQGFGAPGGIFALPLRHEDLTDGALVLVNSGERGEIDNATAEMVRDYGARSAVALHSADAYSAQAEATAVLEASLLPAELPEVPGTAWSAAYRPAQRGLRVGGDFYDVYPDEDGGALFLLGDVCGNGVEAAALAGRIRQSLQALRLVEAQPARLLHLLNRAILSTGDNRFATLVLGALRRGPDGGLRLTLASGGHPCPVLVRADGQVEEVAVPGTLVGVLPDPHFGETEVVLAPGEVCLLYSDGVTEARGGSDGVEQFGLSRLCEALSGGAGLNAAELTWQVEQELDRWLGGRDHDDVALLAVQALLS
ncbi:PP2C family protein-serine/threonine phosphatase [Kutzneria viridogrisea]|uniref:Serine phosphatase RsbU (Regulator of sigma subunit) n=1 Tax=Kutzneria viridogrisea TaxID=47990 RepID=A0ABR6BEN3_9PSEU|nr:serine phosphatase RsbU (regulator of sigma subunit) [Kutzneria viridogrisea]